MVFYCNSLPFSELGFVQQDDNLWVKYTNDTISVPYFVLTTTINPSAMTFIVKDLLKNKTFSANSYDLVKEFVITRERENKIKKILN